jgi:Ser/Thr protein kinase RdoA (MazF antagonist)
VPEQLKPYPSLSRTGRLRRLRRLALAGLAEYDLDAPKLSFFGWHTNLLYRVTTADGAQYMLRVAAPRWRSLDDLRSEAMWLEALDRDTDVGAPRVIAARGGDKVFPAASPGVPEARNVTLMTWVLGHLLGHHLNEANLAKMGELFARLHGHGAAWQPPAGFTTRRFEGWLSRGEENRLFGEGAGETAEAATGGGVAGLPAPSRELLQRVRERVDSAYAAIDRADLRVIHCDLWHDNVKLHKGAVHPIDFEDTVWGFRAHDIAMAMLDLLETVGEGAYPKLLAAFRRGYGALMSWPVDAIEPFMAGRLLWKMNWVARFQAEDLGAMVERHVPVFEHLERTGEIILPRQAT